MEFEDLLFSHPFPLVVVDCEGKVERVNQKFELLLNRSEKFLKGQELHKLLGSDEILAQIERSFKDEIEVFGFKFKDNFLHFSPFFTSEVKKGVLVIFEPALETTFTTEIQLFLKGLSHEIGNPLGGIKGAAKLFKELRMYDEELVDVIISEVERIERLLNDILKGYDFSTPTFKCENVHRLIQKSVSLFSHRITSMGVKVSYIFDPSLPEIPVDPDKLTQVFINLVKNALEAMEFSQSKELSIETGYAIRPADFLFIRFKDTGIGMDEEELKNLFVPFFTTKEKGTGIGSFIVREVVKGHGGEVKVKSSKGKGTEVLILLPMKRRYGKNSCS